MILNGFFLFGILPSGCMTLYLIVCNSVRPSRISLRRVVFTSEPGNTGYWRYQQLAAVVENISLDKILIETDSPYLSPVPFRGKRNEPSYVLEIAKKIAAIKNISLSDVENTTMNNTLELFNKIS